MNDMGVHTKKQVDSHPALVEQVSYGAKESEWELAHKGARILAWIARKALQEILQKMGIPGESDIEKWKNSPPTIRAIKMLEKI